MYRVVNRTPQRRPQQRNCVDQGSELISRDLDLWEYVRDIVLDFSRTGRPSNNAFAEACNEHIRAEFLYAHWFLTLADGQEKLATRRRCHNEHRPI